MATAWLLLLGFLLAGYLVLGGYDYGVQMLAPVLGRDDDARRTALGSLGPFFLGNEVWLVAVVGVLFGAFPTLEGTLLAGLFPLLVVLLVALVVGTTAVQLRGRLSGTRSRRVADVLMATGGVVPAAVWGMVVTVLLRGVPVGADGHFALGARELLDPFVLAGGVTAVVLFAAHGATFLALRCSGHLAARSTRAASGLARGAAGAVVVTALTGVLTGLDVADPLTATAAGAVAVAALVAASVLVGRERSGPAFAGTCVAAAAPVFLLGLAHAPDVLVATDPRFTVSVADAAAAPETLALLSVFGVFLVPTILAYQVWNWWAFRGRVDTPTYF